MWVCLVLVTYISMYVCIKLQACGRNKEDLMPIINMIEKTFYTPIKANMRFFFFFGKSKKKRIFMDTRYPWNTLGFVWLICLQYNYKG